MAKIKNYASNLTCNYKPKMKIISNLQQFYATKSCINFMQIKFFLDNISNNCQANTA